MTPKRRPLFGIPPRQWFAVFAVIVLMYAILFPVFQKVHEGNGRDYCQSNLKQLGLALIQYEQDADETYPPGINTAGNGWGGQIYYFIKSTGIYKCPKDAQEGNFISYAENQNTVKQSVSNFADPRGTVALYEFTTLNCDPSQPETISTTGLSAPQNSARHDSQTFGLNFLFVDGHVKRLTPGQVSGGANAVPPTHRGSYLATFAVK